MIYLRSLTVGLICALIANASAYAEQTTGVGEKAMLQVSMQRHIDRSLVNGAYLHMIKETGDVQELHPVAAHPMILKMGEYFVLCSDFQDKNAKSVNIDFYMARRGDTFIVFQALVDDRKPLVRLIKAGKASRVN